METADVDISKYFFINLTLKECISFLPLSSSIVFCGMSYVVVVISSLTFDINQTNVVYKGA